MPSTPHFQLPSLTVVKAPGYGDRRKAMLEDEGAVVGERVKAMSGDEGFNAQTEEYGNLVDAGVIDPAKVVRSALQNAASIASLLLTTEAVISQISEEPRHAGGPSGRVPRGM